LSGALAVLTQRRGPLIALGVLVSVAATVLVIRNLDLARTLEIASKAEPPLLLAALALIVIQALVRAIRWQVLLPRAANGRRLPVTPVATAMLVGYLGNTVLPARVGEVIRAAVIARSQGISASAAFGSAVLERVVDVFVLALLGLAAATAISAPAWVGATSLTAAALGGGALIVISVIALAASRRTGEPARLTKLISQLAAGGRILDRRGDVLIATVLTIGAWLLDAGVIWCVGRSIGIDLPPAGAMLVSVVAVLSTAIPTAPGYVGTFELAAVAAVGISGVTGETALAFAILAHVVAVLPLSIAGAVSLWLAGAPSLTDLGSGSPAPTSASAR
jgi:uncharacterized protein (TIRG00374 family)